MELNQVLVLSGIVFKLVTQHLNKNNDNILIKTLKEIDILPILLIVLTFHLENDFLKRMVGQMAYTNW